MARNVEIKARIASIDAIAQTVAAMADRGPVEIRQDDTFFTCERGRVKLRARSATEGETHLLSPRGPGRTQGVLLRRLSDRIATPFARRCRSPMVKRGACASTARSI